MKAYTNKLIRTSSAVCLYSEIKANYKAAKKAVRQAATKEIKTLID